MAGRNSRNKEKQSTVAGVPVSRPSRRKALPKPSPKSLPAPKPKNALRAASPVRKQLATTDSKSLAKVGKKAVSTGMKIAGRANAATLALHSKPAGEGSDKPQGGRVPYPPQQVKPKSSPAVSSTSKTPAKSSFTPKKTTAKGGKGVSTLAGAKKTAGGDYPIYKKDSKPAGDFRSAFAAARKAGKSEFTWNGRRYNTKTK